MMLAIRHDLPSLNILLYIGKYNGMGLKEIAAKMYEEYGDIVRIKGFPQKPDMIFIYNFDLIEKVISNCNNHKT